MPFPTPAPLAAFSISSSERLDAGRCKRPGSVTVQPQYSAMLLQSRAKVDGRGFGGGFWREGFLLAWETGLLPVNESPEKSASETLQQVCVSLQRMWPAHPTALSGETTARAIQMFPRFHLTVRTRPEAKVQFTSQQQAAGECRMRGVSLCHPGKLLERRKLSLPTVRSWEPGTRQQDLEKKPSTSVLPPCPGSSPRTKKTDRQEAAPQAKSTSTALPTPEASQRSVQEVWNLSSQWDQTKSSWPLYQKRIKQARAEMAAWEAWSQGEDQETPQVTRQHDWIPHPPAQPRSKEVVRRWRKVQIPAAEEEWRAAAKLESLQPDARCWYRNGGEGAGNAEGSSGALSKGAGKLSRFPPLNGK
nr:uncharacterized protein LOC119714852 isoform X2 [Anas platyrhynchos]